MSDDAARPRGRALAALICLLLAGLLGGVVWLALLTSDQATRIAAMETDAALLRTEIEGLRQTTADVATPPEAALGAERRMTQQLLEEFIDRRARKLAILDIDGGALRAVSGSRGPEDWQAYDHGGDLFLTLDYRWLRCENDARIYLSTTSESPADTPAPILLPGSEDGIATIHLPAGSEPPRPPGLDWLLLCR